MASAFLSVHIFVSNSYTPTQLHDQISEAVELRWELHPETYEMGGTFPAETTQLLSCSSNLKKMITYTVQLGTNQRDYLALYSLSTLNSSLRLVGD